MNKFLMTTLFIAATSLSTAYANTPIQNTISFNVSQQTWIKSNSARVNINVNASLNRNQFNHFQESVMKRLQKLSKADWHIIRFNQGQSQSGLNNVSLTAQARIPSDELGSINHRAQKLSHAGQHYSVQSIQRAPSFIQMENAKEQLRLKLYQSILKQLNDTNAVFKKHPFHINRIYFQSTPIQPWYDNTMNAGAPQALNMMVKRVGSSGGKRAANISQKLTMTADVTLSNLQAQ